MFMNGLSSIICTIANTMIASLTPTSVNVLSPLWRQDVSESKISSPFVTSHFSSFSFVPPLLHISLIPCSPRPLLHPPSPPCSPRPLLHPPLPSFLRIGFPMMLITTLTAMCYLLICHAAAGWNVEDSARECIERG